MGWFLNHKLVFNFVKPFLCINRDYHHMVFIFQFVNIVYHVNWFAHSEESLHPWDKPHLNLVYDPFHVFLFWFLLEFSSGFLHWCSSVMLACNFLFCVAFLLHFGSWWWWLHRMSWERSSLHIFLEQFDQHRYYHISTIWEHSPVKSRAFVCWRLLITVSSACDWSVHS